MSIAKKLLAVTGVLLLVSTLTITASEESKKQEKTDKTLNHLKEAGNKDKAESGISANELVKKAYATIGNLKKFSFDATIVNEDDLGGDMMVYIHHHYKVSLMDPDKVRMDVRGDTENKDLYINNGTVSIVNDDNKSYGQVKVSPDIDDAIDDLRENYGFAIPLTQFLYSDMDEDINASTKGYYLGTVYIDKTPCYYVAFPGKKWDVQYWIEKGDIPLIRKVAYVDKLTKGQPRSMITVNWDLNTAIDEKIFDFKVPQGAQKAEVLTLEESKKLIEKMKKKNSAEVKDKK